MLLGKSAANLSLGFRSLRSQAHWQEGRRRAGADSFWVKRRLRAFTVSLTRLWMCLSSRMPPGLIRACIKRSGSVVDNFNFWRRGFRYTNVIRSIRWPPLQFSTLIIVMFGGRITSSVASLNPLNRTLRRGRIQHRTGKRPRQRKSANNSNATKFDDRDDRSSQLESASRTNFHATRTTSPTGRG